MFDGIVEVLRAAWWVYPLLFGLVVVDSVLPVLPSETALITVGVIAAGGGLALVPLLACGIAGAVVGDSLAYALGRGPGEAVRDRIFRGRRARERLRWASEQLDDRPWLITVARFVPGGRTAATFSAGTLGVPPLRFLVFAAAGGALWAPLNVMLGVLGGRVFEGSLVLPLACSLTVAAGLAGLGELAHRRGWLDA